MSGQDKDKTNRKPDVFEYELPGGYQVLAGKTDAENDFLSIKFAAAEPTKDVIKQAAAVAAYHSKARTGGVVPVSCARAKHVTKVRGDRPGTVHIRKETVIKVRPAVPDKVE